MYPPLEDAFVLYCQGNDSSIACFQDKTTKKQGFGNLCALGLKSSVKNSVVYFLKTVSPMNTERQGHIVGKT